MLGSQQTLTIVPKELSELFNVFARLEKGESVALGFTNGVSIQPAKGAFLGVLSSGSTGRAKLVWRSWEELLRGVCLHRSLWGWTWASSFSPESFAGVQVALQAWRTAGSIISLGTDWADNHRMIGIADPRALSSTPTFLDLLLQFETERSWKPTQITLGGEILQPLAGARFRTRFPNTRFSVVYAAAEHGILLKTQRLDGWYESAALGERGKDWRVEDEVLELYRGNEWVATKDRIEVAGALVRITGRADGIVNIAGVKVSLEDVALLAEEVPGVRRAVAYPIPSRLVGQVVALRFEPESNHDCEAVKRCVEMHLRTHLRKEAWPRHWEIGLVGVGRNSKRVSG